MLVGLIQNEKVNPLSLPEPSVKEKSSLSRARAKSPLLNSIALLFGKRLDKNYVNDKKCIIEAVFEINQSISGPSFFKP